MKKITYICDRCGKEIKDGNAGESILYRVNPGTSDFPSTTYFVRMLSYRISQTIRSDDERMHFCDECKNAFRDFMEVNREKDTLRM